MASQVVSGFSLTNRMLLYASVLLAPAQLISGIKNNCPSNLGFLAYNWYTQIQWLNAVKSKQLHALSLTLQHFNLMYAISYLGGISSGSQFTGVFLGLGTAGVILLNTASAWISWKTNQPEGFGTYHFFFFGWHILNHNWHKFLLAWQIFDTLTAASLSLAAITHSINIPVTYPNKLSYLGSLFTSTQVVGADPYHRDDGDTDDSIRGAWIEWSWTILAIPVGSILMLFIAWPLVLWTELIVAKNHIESDTDWVAVWLFVAQAVAMIVPPCTAYLRCFRS